MYGDGLARVRSRRHFAVPYARIPCMNDEDLVYQIHTHLLYELKWLIFAATEFAKGSSTMDVPLIDSASVHARNLLEFAKLTTPGRFTLSAVGGIHGRNKEWERFLNNRVTHMHSREKDRPRWPDGLDNERPDRLVKMAGVVLALLQANGATIKLGKVRNAYDEIVGAAIAYLEFPSEEAHATLARLYDDSRDDQRPYA